MPKNNFEKDVISLTKTNHKINITSENSVSGNTSFKKDLNAKSFKMFWEYCSSCGKHDAAASVPIARVIWTYMCDVNSALRKNSKEPSSTLMWAETSFDDDNSNKEALNVNKILSVIIANKMGYILCSYITSPNPIEGVTENIREGLHY